MTEVWHPSLVFLLGALFALITRGPARALIVLATPVIGFFNISALEVGTYWQVSFLGFDLVFGRVDKLSLLFAYIYHLISFIGMLYLLNFKSGLEFVSGLCYGAGAIGVVFAGDLLSFLVFWETLTISAAMLILARRTTAAYEAAMRYVLVHVVGGLVLFAGILLHIHEVGSPAFNEIGLGTLGSYLIFIGFGVNCAWPILHAWLPDAYPEATVGGAVLMSAFTTKTAVYALARGFPGEPSLIWIGAAMAVLPIFYAVIENDLRRVLSYSLMNQVGFMVVGIGIGTQLSLNGTSAHVFTHILYKALLFMSIGAVLYQTGRSKATDLGGLFRSMPFTCICCIIGAASISAFPLFSGFISKSMVMSSAGIEHHVLVWFLLLFASAGVFHHAGIKIPFFAFFGHDSGIRVKEAPWNMRLAMGIAAALCLILGIFPHDTLYPLLPFDASYEPYTADHVIAQTQLLFFSALAFTLLLLAGVYPPEIACVNVDSDWFYRRGARVFYRWADQSLNGLNRWCARVVVGGFFGRIVHFFKAAPVHIAQVFLRAFAQVQGLPPAVQAEQAAELRENFRAGAFPVGISAALAVLLVAGLYLLQ